MATTTIDERVPVQRDDRLLLREATPVVHALVQRVASDLGVRVLFIKGPVLTDQGLQPAHQSVDVDVLVDPSRVGDLLAALEGLGWSEAVLSTSARTIPLHSRTVRHPGWPCEIDVHDRFPGFLADPQTVFETLWRHRTVAPLAGRLVPCPTEVAHTAIAALHWLRDPELGDNPAKLARLAAVVDALFDDADRRALLELAEATGSVETLAPLLSVVGIDVADVPSGHDSADWRIRTASTGVKTVPWLVELRRTPGRRVPRFLLHALLLTEAEIRAWQPGLPAGPRGLLLGRLRRLRWGLRDLPQAARIVRHEGRRG